MNRKLNLFFSFFTVSVCSCTGSNSNMKNESHVIFTGSLPYLPLQSEIKNKELINKLGSEKENHHINKMIINNGLDNANYKNTGISVNVPSYPNIKDKVVNSHTISQVKSMLSSDNIDNHKSLFADNKNEKVNLVPVITYRTWKINKGTTLRKSYEQWVSQEVCGNSGKKWNLRWDTNTDYSIDYDLTFQDKNFEGATEQLFKLWHNAKVPLYVNGYRLQCLVVVSDPQ